ncbi:uncharacterized protein LOC133800399 [Humulus lupulus]|uniref:uncharacterized protein LOC133800399 n=1 Tax=Humulus lupulus TaxID=3486 RepID=UPI002B40095E|nr:uncharacterized protein LOC133800399 [Humulus lupulus]
MLCHRLVDILPNLINQNQGAFIKDRSLAHNALILQDLIKGYKRKHSSPRCLMKIYLSKAYDSIDWDFLENLLKALRFPGRFIRWVMICMRGSSYCLMMNGQLQANTSSIQIIHHTLDAFSSASGMVINKNKSRIYFGGVSVPDKSVLLNLTQLAEGEFPLTYLGLPLRPTKWKAMYCDLILKKIRQRLFVWASRNLSYAGRVQLIQTVLLGIRNYWMSIFYLPQSVIKEIDHLCRMFLWGGKGTRSKFHLTSWEQICSPKSHGGLGFKERPLWNRVMLAKFIWAISSKQDFLWVKWVNYRKSSRDWVTVAALAASVYFICSVSDVATSSCSTDMSSEDVFAHYKAAATSSGRKKDSKRVRGESSKTASKKAQTEGPSAAVPSKENTPPPSPFDQSASTPPVNQHSTPPAPSDQPHHTQPKDTLANTMGLLTMTTGWRRAGAMVSQTKNFVTRLAEAMKALEGKNVDLLEKNTELVKQNGELLEKNAELTKQNDELLE